ncbi:hypothetical protein GOV04_02795 [Candidatus Woesearchaeota archaeon]|nr:hypothetical protein [Candidatus Woesearchaeota archaeon]
MSFFGIFDKKKDEFEPSVDDARNLPPPDVAPTGFDNPIGHNPNQGLPPVGQNLPFNPTDPGVSVNPLNAGPIGADRAVHAKDKDIELVLSKLDSIRAHIDAINQRLENIEREMHNENKDKPW